MSGRNKKVKSYTPKRHSSVPDDPHPANGFATSQLEPAAIASADAFDLAKLRLGQNFAEAIGVRKALLTVPVRKPDRQWFVRVHPDPAYRLDVAVLELKDERETYLVDPALLPELPGEVAPKILFTAINRQEVLFLWPVRLPNVDGRRDNWGNSALQAAQLAVNRWVRIASNMSLGAYDVFEASGEIPDPVWPVVDFKKLLEIGFHDRFIRTLDHPVIKKLRGAL
jgi:hypothetical protein